MQIYGIFGMIATACPQSKYRKEPHFWHRSERPLPDLPVISFNANISIGSKPLFDVTRLVGPEPSCTIIHRHLATAVPTANQSEYPQHLSTTDPDGC